MAKAADIAPSATTIESPLVTKKSTFPVGAVVAEFVGTFMLAGAVIATSGQPLYAFFTLAALSAIIGGLSGAHLNPALTFGAWITRQIPALRALGYVAAQLAGAMLAFVVLSSLLGGTPGNVNPYTGQSVPAEIFKVPELVKGKEWYALAAEVLGASIFGFAVARALSEKRERFTSAFSAGGGLLIGLAIAGTTAVLNPAVAIAVQALRFDLWTIVVYAFGPLVGASIGFLIFKLAYKDSEKEISDSAVL